MTLHRSSPSGVVGLAGRVSAREETAVLSADLLLAGERLPLVSPARLYVCGITPYDVTHLGHAATFVWADALAAVMRMAGVEVVTCRNVTDVDDVLTRAAGRRGRYYDDFALGQEYLFEQDMRALGVPRPAYEPHARHHVSQVLQLAAALLAAGGAYQREGHVFFRGSSAAERTGLTPVRARELSAEYGDDPADDLRDDPFDVPVWRPSAEQDPAWPSPWGWGRPGWHAECAAMAISVLGASVDVLVGGQDLAFPHHTYQAAMAEAASRVVPFARSRLHIGAVHKDGAKMAKSTGNLTLVSDLLVDHPPAAVRLLLLDRVWSKPWEYRAEHLAASAARLERLYSAAGRPDTSAAASTAVTAALLHDLDVPQALDLAEGEGGEAARLVLRVLSLA
jgi:cysteinyl-tRNA synthetase